MGCLGPRSRKGGGSMRVSRRRGIDQAGEVYHEAQNGRLGGSAWVDEGAEVSSSKKRLPLTDTQATYPSGQYSRRDPISRWGTILCSAKWRVISVVAWASVTRLSICRKSVGLATY